jgi:hypothetical protein
MARGLWGIVEVSGGPLVMEGAPSRAYEEEQAWHF